MDKPCQIIQLGTFCDKCKYCGLEFIYADSSNLMGGPMESVIPKCPYDNTSNYEQGKTYG